MERMALRKKSSKPAGGSTKKSQRSGGNAFEFLKEKAEMSILFAGRSWSCKERSRKRDPDNKELQLELLRKQAEQQVQISVVGKWGFWDNRGPGIETKEFWFLGTM